MNKWDERFNTTEYIYGKEPNQFLSSVVEQIQGKNILCLGEGEGRNAVFLAKQGFAVTAVDSSKVGLKKITENLIKAPLKLSIPEGWLGQSLKEKSIPVIEDRPSCIKAFNNQAYW